MSIHLPFVSYAQNLEDVLLWRALGHVQGGFYIDVGANDPEEHSVTKAFYDAGWRGISIEPLPAFHQAFLDQRPRDINLAIAAGSSDGELVLYDVPAVRGWASPEQSVAELHRSEGHEVAELKVPVRTLASVCAEHVRGEIHFLKVDVEGFEGEVLRGMDFARWRPWVLVIEATLPNSRATNHATWEHLVTAQRYRYAWFDGLNRYYVAEEHPELMAHFGIPPNVFDDYVPHHLDKAWRQIDTLRTDATRGWERAAEMESGAIAQRALHEKAAREAAEQRTLRDAAAREAAEQRALHEQAALQAAQQQALHEKAARQVAEQQALYLSAARQAAEQHALHEKAARQVAEQHALHQKAAREASEQRALHAKALHEAAELERQCTLLDQRLHEVEAHAQQAELQVQTLSARLHDTAAWGAELEQRLLATLTSSSWRITAPLRFIARRGADSPAGIARRKAKGAARRGLRWLTSREALRRTLLPLVLRSPKLQALVASTLHAAKQAVAEGPAAGPAVPHSLRELPQSARDALEQLRRAYEPNQE